MTHADLQHRFVLHIGRHKSGTTAIQRHLDSNRLALATAGFDYPLAGTEGLGQHAALAWSLNEATRHPRGGADPGRAKLQFEQYLQQRPADPITTVVSSEAFQSVQPADCVEWFSPNTTTVAVYVREQYSYLRSSYAQSVVTGAQALTFAEYFHANEKLQFWSHQWLLERWSSMYPDLRVRRFDRRTLRDGDVVRDFCAEFLSGFDGNQGQDENPSVGGEALEFKRLINAVADHPDGVECDWVPVLHTLASGEARYRRPHDVGSSLVAGFRARFAASNEELAARFLGEATLFSFEEDPPSVSVPVTLNGESFSELVSHIRAIDSGDACLEWLDAAVPKGNPASSELRGWLDASL